MSPSRTAARTTASPHRRMLVTGATLCAAGLQVGLPGFLGSGGLAYAAVAHPAVTVAGAKL